LVPLATVTDDLATGILRARLFVEGLGKEAVPAQLRVALAGTGQVAETEVLVTPGLNPYEAVLNVPRPNLWWPAGHGAQHRYTVEATLAVAGREVGSRSARIGFRHLRINQEAHAAGGRSFVLEVNHRQVFAKGGNFVPADF